MAQIQAHLAALTDLMRDAQQHGPAMPPSLGESLQRYCAASESVLDDFASHKVATLQLEPQSAR